MHRKSLALSAAALVLTVSAAAHSGEVKHPQVGGPVELSAGDLERITAGAPGNNWGQEVRGCNQTNCYPGGTSRGAYVSGQAQDGDGPGYGYEIQTLANPGNSDPQSGNF